MTKSKRSNKRGGGWFDGVSSSLTNVTNSVTGLFSSKKQPSYSSSQYSSYQPTTSNNFNSTPKSSIIGGKKNGKKKSVRWMNGGFKDNTPTTGLAVNAAPFSGPTAEPKTWVGGKTRRRKHTRRNRHSRSRRHSRPRR